MATLEDEATRGATLHYIGDEIGAAGWRLAGAMVHVPAAGAEEAALAAACGQPSTRHPAALVLLAAPVAARLPAPVLEAALAALSPLALVVPDTQGVVPAPDFTTRMRTQLGMEA